MALRYLPVVLLIGACGYPKADGETMRKDVNTIQERLNSKEKTLDEQITALQKATEEATKVLKRNSADLGADVDKLRDDVRVANGLVQGMSSAVNQLQQSFDAYKKANDAKLDALDQRIAQLESGKPSANSSADDLWRLGKQAFEGGRYQDAIEIFKRLTATYPQDPHAADATYFRGLSYTNLKDFDHAIGVYQQLLDKYPQSELADDGLYFAAQGAVELKNCTEARAYLGTIKSKYPKSNVLKQSEDLDKQIKANQKNKAKCSS